MRHYTHYFLALVGLLFLAACGGKRQRAERIISVTIEPQRYFAERIAGERFADTVARLGFDYVNEKLLSGSIDKDAILHKTVKGGATC